MIRVRYKALFESTESRREIEKLADVLLEKLQALANRPHGVYFSKGIISKYGSGSLTPFLNEVKGMSVKIKLKTSSRTAAYVMMGQKTRDFSKNRINLYFEQDELENIDSLMYNRDYFGLKKIFQQRRESLIHELTHAYDDWRSGGHALYGDAYESDVASDQDSYTQYLNRKHEIDARFAQLLSTSKIKDLKLSGKFNKYKTYFFNNFVGWSVLEKDMQTYLIKKLSKEFYELTDEERERIVAKHLGLIVLDIGILAKPNYSDKSDDRIANVNLKKELIMFIKNVKIGKIKQKDFMMSNAAKFGGWTGPIYGLLWENMSYVFGNEESKEALQNEVAITDKELDRVYKKYFKNLI